MGRRTKDSKTPEAAWAFLRFVTGPAGQESMLRTGGSQPMTDGTDDWVLADLPHLARGVLTQSPAHASWHPSPRVVEWDDVDRAINGQLDLPDVTALACPRPLLVLQGTQDRLFPLDGVRRALEHIGAVYDLAGAPGRYAGRLYDAPHRFDLEMQEEAFAWLDHWL